MAAPAGVGAHGQCGPTDTPAAAYSGDGRALCPAQTVHGRTSSPWTYPRRERREHPLGPVDAGRGTIRGGIVAEKQLEVVTFVRLCDAIRSVQIPVQSDIGT